MKVLLSCLFVLASLLSYSQDLIVKRDSSVLFCKIIKEDSAAIYYRQTQGEQMMELSIKKTDVLSYYSRKANAINELRRADSLARVQQKRDTVNAKNDSLKSQISSLKSKSDSLQRLLTALAVKKDSVQIKKDTMRDLKDDRGCTDFKIGTTIDRTDYKKEDTIFLNINYKCFYKGELITKKEALALMTGYGSRKEMKLARSYYAPVIPLGLGALVLAGVFIYDAVGPGDFHWVMGGGSVIAAALAITFKHYSNVHIYKAVKLYNANRDVAVVNMPKFELGMASKGVGLCLKF